MNEEQRNILQSILVVDDEEAICASLRELLKNKYKIFVSTSVMDALDVIKENSNGNICKIDLVLADICLDGADGIMLLKRIKERNPKVEVIMITGYPNTETTLSALRLGASDYIIKPFDQQGIINSIQHALDKQRESRRNGKLLDDLRKAIRKNYSATTDALLLAIDAKDNYTKQHCARVADLIMKFSKWLDLKEEERELLKKVAMLHDIGKIGIREEVLKKQGKLTPEEWEEIKLHPDIGYQIIQPVEFLEPVRKILLYHQERFDGKGYPKGLKGEEIPLGARMLTIADSYDAMVTDRPYRNKLSIETALSELKKCAGIQFDPELVDKFIDMIRKDGT